MAQDRAKKKAYLAEYYRRHKSDMNAASAEYYHNHKEQSALATTKVHAARKKLIDDIKSKPCMDCGASYPPYVMDFDHRPGTEKVGLVSSLWRNHRQDVARTEIDKCDLVCSNCHRERTHQRKVWRRNDN